MLQSCNGSRALLLSALLLLPQTGFSAASAFSRPDAALSFEQRMNFNLGESIFAKLWVSAPASTQASDGLGPLYNARSCLRCHPRNGRGQPPEAESSRSHSLSMILKLSLPPDLLQPATAHELQQRGYLPEPVYGAQIQDQAIQGLAAEARIRIAHQPLERLFPDGERVILQQPSYRLEQLSYGPLHPATRTSARVAPPMIGLGLLEAIPEEELLRNVRDQQQHPEVNGQVNRVYDRLTGTNRIGRFGWKALHPTVYQQNAAAFFEDIGISTRLFPQGYGACTPAQETCRALPDGNSEHLDGVEASDAVMDVLTFYTRTLAVPARRATSHPAVQAGEALFHQTGCAACHRPGYTTAANAALPQLANRTIQPFTDLLLHDMGAELADGFSEFLASGQHWRTPPLWGIGLTRQVNGHSRFLHDGRARDLQEAILWHGGEALGARQRYMNLPRAERGQLLQFLESL